MMKRLFNAPEMAITKFDAENIVTNSIMGTSTYQSALGYMTGGENDIENDNIFTFFYE